MKTIITLFSLLIFGFVSAQSNNTVTVDVYNRGDMMMKAAEYDIMRKAENENVAKNNQEEISKKLIELQNLSNSINDNTKQDSFKKQIALLLNENIQLLDYANKSSYNRRLKKLERKVFTLHSEIEKEYRNK